MLNYLDILYVIPVALMIHVEWKIYQYNKARNQKDFIRSK